MKILRYAEDFFLIVTNQKFILIVHHSKIYTFMRISTLLTSTVLAVVLVFLITSCKVKESVKSNSIIENQIINADFGGNSALFHLQFTKGKNHNHPTMAIWIEATDGTFIRTLFVTKSLATGIYNHGDAGNGTWLTVPGEAKRPATLPVWLHKREKLKADQALLPDPQNPLPDAVTGATPSGNFDFIPKMELPEKFRILVEVNQAWDWNEHWTNNLYPDDKDYHTSAQPSLVYAVNVDMQNNMDEYYLNPIGHGHYSGKDGKLYTNISTFTTALKIFDSIVLKVQ